MYVAEDPKGLTGVKTGPTMENPPVRIMGHRGSGPISLVLKGDPIPANHVDLNLVILANSGTMLIMSDDFLNSNTIQMVAFQQFDHSLWELVYKSGYARVFKLKKDSPSTEDTVESAVEGS